MREIKIRGKCKVSGEWVYGVPIPNSFGDRVFMIPLLLADKIAYPFERLVDWVVEVWPETIGESTGLKDKKDVAIFEGDLVRFTNGIDEIDNEVGKVVWEQSECNFVAQYKTTNRATQKENGTTKTIYLICNEIYRKDVEYEVIGNIYENPDLLEVSE